MFWLSEQTRVFLRTGVTDGRLGIDALPRPGEQGDAP